MCHRSSLFVVARSKVLLCLLDLFHPRPLMVKMATLLLQTKPVQQTMGDRPGFRASAGTSHLPILSLHSDSPKQQTYRLC
jgi:hypothetical protein